MQALSPKPRKGTHGALSLPPDFQRLTAFFQHSKVEKLDTVQADAGEKETAKAIPPDCLNQRKHLDFQGGVRGTGGQQPGVQLCTLVRGSGRARAGRSAGESRVPFQQQRETALTGCGQCGFQIPGGFLETRPPSVLPPRFKSAAKGAGERVSRVPRGDSSPRSWVSARPSRVSLHQVPLGQAPLAHVDTDN